MHSAKILVRHICQEARADSGAIFSSHAPQTHCVGGLIRSRVVIPGYGETYVDLDIHMSVRGKLVALDGSALDPADNTTVVNNLLHSLFSQCNVTLNGVSVFVIQGSLQLQGVLRDSTHARARRFAKSSHKRIVAFG